MKPVQIDEVLPFDMYFASILSANLGAELRGDKKKLTTEQCAGLALEMVRIRRSVVPQGD